MGSQRVQCNWATSLYILMGRKWHFITVLISFLKWLVMLTSFCVIVLCNIFSRKTFINIFDHSPYRLFYCFTPHWRSGTVVLRRYPSSKVRSSGCALLEQLWRDTPCQGKRNPSKTVGVARGHQRADTLKSYSQKTSQSNHTRTTTCLSHWN